MDLNDFIPAIRYGATMKGGLAQGVPFIASASVGSVALISGVTILADSAVTDVSATAKVYLQGLTVANPYGSTALEQTAGGPALSGMLIQDSAGTPFFTILAGGSTYLGGGDFVGLSSGTARVSSGSIYREGTGGGIGKGVQIKMGSVGTISSGSTFYATVWGIIK